MMSKKQLKKSIARSCGDLAAVTFYTRDYVDNVDTAAANALICRLADLQARTINKCTFSFDKVPHDFDNRREYRNALAAYRKAAYKNLLSEFDKEVAEAVKALNALMTPEQRKEVNL